MIKSQNPKLNCFRVYAHNFARGGYAYLRCAIPGDGGEPFIERLEFTCGRTKQDRRELRKWATGIKQSLAKLTSREVYIFGHPRNAAVIPAFGAGVIARRVPGLTLASFYCTPTPV
jgi:hypothetical protein